MNKLIHYKIPVSPRFPSTHPRKGEPTYFVEKIYKPEFGCFDPKLHTIRDNYELWAKRMPKVHAGLAVIDLFYWKLPGGRFTPGNEQIIFATLDKKSGCGVQKAFIKTFTVGGVMIPENDYSVNSFEVAKNDGLSLEDFKSWFRGYDLSTPKAIIQFTKFRY